MLRLRIAIYKTGIAHAVPATQLRYRNTGFDNRMFILPKDIQGKFCYIIFWGLYATKDEALKALSTVPAYFGDREIKPKLTIIKQYL